MPIRTIWASSSRPTGARCSSTRSAISRCICRRNCCAPSRTGASSGWAARRPGPSTSGSSAPRIWIWKHLCIRDVSGKTYTIASIQSISRCPHFGSVKRISFRWRNCSCSASPRSIIGLWPGLLRRPPNFWKPSAGAATSASSRTASRRRSSCRKGRSWRRRTCR